MPFKQPFKPKWKSPLGDFATQVDVSPSALSKPPKSPIPKDNPFRVGLEPYQPPSKADIRAGNILGDILESGKKLTGPGIQIATDTVTEKATVAVLGKTVATVVGVVAVPFVAADLFDILAPGVKAWLTGGWKGRNGRTVPYLLGDLEEKRGRCATRYTFATTYTVIGEGITYTKRETRFDGPVRGFDVRPAPNAFGGVFWTLFVTGMDGVEVNLGNESQEVSTRSLDGFQVERLDGLVDACAVERGPDKPPDYVKNPKPAPTPEVPSPAPSPLSGPVSGNLPSTQKLSDLFGNPLAGVPPAPFGDNPSAPNPSTQTKVEDPTLSLPYSYPLPPRNPTPPLEESGDCNPCLLAIGRKLDELREKLEEEKEDDDSGEETTCETFTFQYSYGVCSSDGFAIEPRTLILAQEPPANLRNEFDNMLALAAQGCASEPVSAIPDWWQVRIGADRPQIVVAFRKADSTTYHQISIPHPESTVKWAENLMGDYRKGPWSGILTLKDNSKFIINCETKAEAQRMVNIAKSLIRPDMIFSPSVEQFTERKGHAVGVAQMRGRQAYYFSTGQKSAKPDWRAQFQ
jgi:hypothetical protein